MNRPTSRLQHHKHEHEHELQQTGTQQQNSQQQAAVEFATAEDMLRHDAAQTPVPPAVAERLQKSLESEPKPSLSWWRRLFGPS